VPTLYIFSGLPAAGKSTLAQVVARHVDGVYLRIDTIEQGLRDLCSIPVRAEGYELAYRIAGDNLRLGRHVVADSCNPVHPTRVAWENVAAAARARYINIEIVCSDAAEHHRRAQSRVADVPGLALPAWSAIMTREYQAWTVDRVVVDTAGVSSADAASELLATLAQLHDHSASTS
jgi:predicted kinase